MILYADTSALIKLDVAEAGSAEVRFAVQRNVAVCSHAIVYVQMRAAFTMPSTWPQRSAPPTRSEAHRFVSLRSART